MSDDERFQRLFDEFGKIYRAMEAFEAKAAAQQLEYWKATAAALRGLSDWQARDAATAQQEREHYRKRWDRLHWAAIVLNAIVLLFLMINAIR